MTAKIQHYKSCKQRIPESLIIKWVQDISAGLQYLHAHGVLHMNLSPNNVLFDASDTIQLGDYGVNYQLQRTTVQTEGGVPYMSPEMIKGEECDNATDVWSFGCILYTMCCLQARWS